MVAKTNIQLCPFSETPRQCSLSNCRGCEVLVSKIAAALDLAKKQRDIIANLEDFWLHQASGAET